MIFVSIAAFKDPDVVNTINDLFEMAQNPSQIRVVVLNQIDMESYAAYTINHPQVEFFNIDASKSRGVCWARSIIQSMIRDEDYYLQIDAHMRFAQDWDAKMIQYLKKANSLKPVLSFYPPPFDENGRQMNIQRNIVRGVGSGAVSSIGQILDPKMVEAMEGAGYPIRCHTSAAGFLFAPMAFVREVPIDPKLYWNFEETDITLRGFTNGWDFFATPEPIIWHRYNTTGKLPHMDEAGNWVELENASNAHAVAKYFDPNYRCASVYKLGMERIIEEFNILYNLDLKSKVRYEQKGKKMLVVVPYRDRAEHLKKYLEVVPSYFSTDEVDILLCELDMGCEWNAGMTANSAINFMFRDAYEYIYISHVDVYPQGEWAYPQYGEFITDLGDVGSCVMRKMDFLSVGGYGNNFWGWGAEDDNLYMKLWSKNLRRVQSNIQYDTAFQNHPRPFNGVNYTNNLREFEKNYDYTPIFNVNKVSKTYDLRQLGENIFHQRVKSLEVKQKNKKVVLGYIKGIDSFSRVAPFIKSAVYHGTDYDVCIIACDDKLTNEIKIHGGKVYQWTPVEQDPFHDRWKAYRAFVSEHDYEQILHVDVTDSYFAANPFTRIKNDFVVVSEGLTFDECLWNQRMIKGIYGYAFDKDVICAGVLYGVKDKFLEVCNKMIEEGNQLPHSRQLYGSDQPLLNKLIHSQELTPVIYSSEDALAVHLHHHFTKLSRHKEDKIDGLKVSNLSNTLYSIVHQYNRDVKLASEVEEFFRSFFSLSQVH